jgi:hypothetical protein
MGGTRISTTREIVIEVVPDGDNLDLWIETEFATLNRYTAKILIEALMQWVNGMDQSEPSS